MGGSCSANIKQVDPPHPAPRNAGPGFRELAALASPAVRRADRAPRRKRPRARRPEEKPRQGARGGRRGPQEGRLFQKAEEPEA